MIIKTLRRGWRMAEVPSHEHRAAARRVAHPRLARRAAVRLLARQVPVLLSDLQHIVNILGIWDGHDSGAALLQDGRLRFAVNEERLTRRKLEIAFPDALDRRLPRRTPASRPEQIDVVAASTSDPAKTLGRLVAGEQGALLRRAPPQGAARPARRPDARAEVPDDRVVARAGLARRSAGARCGGSSRGTGSRAPTLRLVDHHEAHAAAAAWASGFAPCAVLTIDGLGDGLSATISAFRDGRLERVAASPARSSLGVFFEHVTNLLNMRELEDEGKVMALADYAAPIADDDNPLLPWVRVRDGVIRDRAGPGTRCAGRWRGSTGGLPTNSSRIWRSASVEQCCVALARDAVRLTGLRRLALAGGVVSNVKATRGSALLPEVEDVYVFPHMGDGGLALGAAVARGRGGWRAARPRSRSARPRTGLRSTRSSRRAFARAGFSRRLPSATLPSRVADLLADGRIVMWFQGAHGVRPARARTPQRAGAARSRSTCAIG